MAHWIFVATVAAISFLGVLGMRVMLIENSFEASTDPAESNAPQPGCRAGAGPAGQAAVKPSDRAQKLGMTTSNNSVTVDIGGTGQ